MTWFFLFYTLYGFYAVSYYGVPLDELTQRVIGIENNRYIAGEESREDLSKHSYFGPVFESISVFAENLFITEPMRTKILVRHFELFAVFLLSVYCIYKIAQRVFANHKIPIYTVVLFYALHPRIFADAHYNSKDLFLMCMMVFSVHHFIKWSVNSLSPSLRSLLISAFLLGIAASVRMHAVVLIPVYLVYLLIHKRLSLKTAVFSALLFVLGFYLCFPYYWAHPIDSFLHQFKYLTQNPWPWDILTDGEYLPPKALPWNYIPKWIYVTTPLLISLLVLIGLFSFHQFRRNRYFLFFYILTALPLILVWTMKPTVYDGWRHFMFLYFPLCFLCGFALNYFVTSKLLNYLIPSLLLIYLLANQFLYFKKEYAYFNEYLSTGNKAGLYLQDYWNVSSKLCVDKIEKQFKGKKIKLYSFTEAADFGYMLLPERRQQTLVIEHHRDSADYELQLKRSRFFEPEKREIIWNYTTPNDTLARLIKLR